MSRADPFYFYHFPITSVTWKIKDVPLQSPYNDDK